MVNNVQIVVNGRLTLIITRLVAYFVPKLEILLPGAFKLLIITRKKGKTEGGARNGHLQVTTLKKQSSDNYRGQAFISKVGYMRCIGLKFLV